jgi:hypothetical protein
MLLVMLQQHANLGITIQEEAYDDCHQHSIRAALLQGR